MEEVSDKKTTETSHICEKERNTLSDKDKMNDLDSKPDLKDDKIQEDNKKELDPKTALKDNKI